MRLPTRLALIPICLAAALGGFLAVRTAIAHTADAQGTYAGKLSYKSVFLGEEDLKEKGKLPCTLQVSQEGDTLTGSLTITNEEMETEGFDLAGRIGHSNFYLTGTTPASVVHDILA